MSVDPFLETHVQRLANLLEPGDRHTRKDLLHVLPLLIWSIRAMHLLPALPEAWLSEFSKIGGLAGQPEKPIGAEQFRSAMMSYYRQSPPHSALLEDIKGFIRESLHGDAETNAEIVLTALFWVLSPPATETLPDSESGASMPMKVEWK